MEPKVYIDGEFFPKSQAKISVYDHGLLYGDGVFEGIRSYNGRVFELEAHVRRLYDSAKGIRLTIPMSPEKMAEAIVQALEVNGLRDGYVRVLVTRGVGPLGLTPAPDSQPTVIIIADQIRLYPKELYDKGLAVVTSSIIRNHPNALSPRIKSLNYLNNVLAKLEAMDAGASEGIMLNGQGMVAECTGDNIFVVRQGELQTPPKDAGILEGITRAAVLRLARSARIPTLEVPLTRYDLYTAEECFLTGTAAEVVPVTRIDGRLVGQGTVGPVTRKLHMLFHDLVRSGA